MNYRCCIRCPWADLTKPKYIEYHDREWGVPLHNDRTFFEFLTLESAQAGLSWYTVLRKRENYRHAFDLFDPEKVASYSKKKIAQLMTDKGIIRNRLKIIPLSTMLNGFFRYRKSLAASMLIYGVLLGASRS